MLGSSAAAYCTGMEGFSDALAKFRKIGSIARFLGEWLSSPCRCPAPQHGFPMEIDTIDREFTLIDLEER